MANDDDLVHRLGELASLHSSGSLTDDEFATAKQRLLGPPPSREPLPSGGSDDTRAPETSHPSTSAVRPAAVASPPDQATVPIVATAVPEPVRPDDPSPTPRATRRPGALIAAAAGGFILVTFLAIPLASLPLVGSITAAQAAAQAGTEGAGGLALLWLIGLAALGIAGYGVRAATASQTPDTTRRTAAIACVVAACLIAVIYLGCAVYLQAQLDRIGLSGLGVDATSIVGAGFWLGLLGAAAAAVGGVVEYRGTAVAPTPAATGSAPAPGAATLSPERRRGLLLAAAAILLTVLLVAIGLALNGGDSDAAPGYDGPSGDGYAAPTAGPTADPTGTPEFTTPVPSSPIAAEPVSTPVAGPPTAGPPTAGQPAVGQPAVAAPSSAGRAAAPSGPTITGTSTYTEGELVYVVVRYRDDGSAVGFGFRGVGGSGWGTESHPFTSPSYGQVSPGQVAYPFNHRCGTGQDTESSIVFWIYDSAGHRDSTTVHLACAE